MNDYLPNFTADLNREKVELDDLILVMKAVHELPPEERDLEGRMLTILRLFEGASLLKCQAIYYRLVALSKILALGDLPYFASPKVPDGSVSVQGEVGQAAVSEPLLFSKHEAYFDPNGFRDRVLSLAEPDCHA